MTKNTQNLTLETIVSTDIPVYIEETTTISTVQETVVTPTEETIVEEVVETVIKSKKSKKAVETPVETVIDGIKVAAPTESIVVETVIELSDETNIIDTLLEKESTGQREYINQSYLPDARMIEMLTKFKNVYISFDGQIIYSGPSSFVKVNKKTLEIFAKHYPLRGLVLKPF